MSGHRAPSRGDPVPDGGVERLGGPPWSATGPLISGLVAMLILIGGVGLWSVKTRISGAVIAPGQVEVAQRRQVVQHPGGGVVQRILVQEGQSVTAGERLLTLDSHSLETELAIVESQYFEILARRGRLEAERADRDSPRFPPELIRQAAHDQAVSALLSGQQNLLTARHETLRQSLAQLTRQAQQIDAQIRGIDAQSDALDKQRGFLQQELRSQRSLLEKGLAQAARVLSLEREAARLDGQMGETAAPRAQSISRRAEIDLVRLEKTAGRREAAEAELRDLGYREVELFERRKALREQISRSEIRAPTSGIVQELQVTTPRSVIRPAEALLYIIPQDRPLIINARINTLHIHDVHIGQRVLLRFPAFSSRSTPDIFGVLHRVSPDALQDGPTTAPYYRGEIQIPATELTKLGAQALIPGMPAEVFLMTTERSPLTYLMKPLTDYFTRALRER